MTDRLGARLLAVLLTAAALLVPAAAHAGKLVTRDTTGDVVTVAEDSSQEGSGVEQFDPAPDRRTGDITRTSIDHRAGLIRVAVDLRRVGNTFGDSLVMRLRTPDGRVDVFVERRGEHTFTDIRRGVRDVACGDLVASVDARADRFLVSLPTSCINCPRWVQVGVLLASIAVERVAE